jgi:hypothetical protein
MSCRLERQPVILTGIVSDDSYTARFHMGIKHLP